jgi:DNA-binding XRE family transcriptional regulator
VTKSYESYAVGRRARLSDAGKTALSVFSTAYAVGGCLHGARTHRGLTQRELAETSGVTQADISRIERGVITPTVPTLLRLVQALGANLAIVFDEPRT